ncbi:DUF4412 domain-containing protein [Flavobacterium pedocola]
MKSRFTLIASVLFMLVQTMAFAQAPQKGQFEMPAKVDASKIPASYAFSWKYSMEIKAKDGKSMIADYFLQPKAGYFAFNMAAKKDMIMIMDTKQKLMISGFGGGASKMARASQIPDYSKMNKKQGAASKFKYKPLPNKVIMGFNCKGVEATNDEYVMTFYYTNEAKVSFGDLFKSQQDQGMSSAFEGFLKPGENALMMSMDAKNLKDKSKSTSMKCVGLEKQAFTFKKADYKFM